MKSVQLPISKSIANRLLIRYALLRDKHISPPLEGLNVIRELKPDYLPDDVRLLHDILFPHPDGSVEPNAIIDCANCGTAFRFLTAYYACQEGVSVTLIGCQRMLERPIGQEVEALRSIGADITYLGQEGFPPLAIRGCRLRGGHVTISDPVSTQFVSALLLIADQTESPLHVHCIRNGQPYTSPYITMTEAVVRNMPPLELDWSSAAFWYERVALGLEDEVLLLGLTDSALQGDRAVVDFFLPLGVTTTFTPQGTLLSKSQVSGCKLPLATCNLQSVPDLAPALAVTCHLLGIEADFTGIESLRFKECDRLAALSEIKQLPLTPCNLQPATCPLPLATHHDHRLAMAYLAAGYQVDDPACISKSYPAFLSQLTDITIVTPRFEPGTPGWKKRALFREIQSASTPYVWTRDADILYPPTVLMASDLDDADLIILPLVMELPFGHGLHAFFQRLVYLEYTALQALTVLSAEWGHPILCSGANLIVRRNKWLSVYSELHEEIPSGDDMFLLEAAKRHGWKIRTCPSKKELTTCNLPLVTCNLPLYTPPATLRAFFRQRMRWAGKAPHYTDRDILSVGFCTFLANLLVVFCPPFALLKWLFDWTLIRTYQKRCPSACHSSSATSHSLRIRLFFDALLLTLLYPFYMLICLLGGLFRQHKW